ncbi:hypothetical protein NM688_g6293 [Phlebia brevispora]|uniref:Uncharacterized protein n=1 Tax=Phlebia brevispora TaxID=194682 RepID=A0ACC1SHJ9_9APHY|nr:hypothetical protein NM688_g6293 [Phlebia brevispora]
MWRNVDTTGMTMNNRLYSLPAAISHELDIFERRIEELDKKLTELANKARELRVGSSVGILSACDRLRSRTKKLSFCFRQNANQLFLPSVQDEREQISAEMIEMLQQFGGDVVTLADCFKQFPAFVHLDDFPDSLSHDFKNWSASLRELKESDEYHSRALQSFLYQSMSDIGERFARLTTQFIPVFIEAGQQRIPIIQASQKHAVTDLSNLPTVAALFAGATATMLQFSYNPSTTTVLTTAVNVCWFTSLVFSITSAVNSILALAWVQAIFRSPDYSVPWFIRVLVRKSPLLFTVLSVACFFVGLVLFTYSSNQSFVTTTIVTALCSVSCFGLISMSFWFEFERWTYSHYKGQKFLADVLALRWRRVMNIPIFHHFLLAIPSIQRRKPFIDPENGTNSESHIGLHKRAVASKDNPEERARMKTDTKARWRMIREYLTQVQGMRTVNVDPPETSMEQSRKCAETAERVVDVMTRPVRVARLRKLRTMRISDTITPDTGMEALVKRLRFSRDGRFLLAASWDKKAWVMEMGVSPIMSDNSLVNQRQLKQEKDAGHIHQVEWSPGGTHFLLRDSVRISICTVKADELRSNPLRPQSRNPIRPVAWLSDGDLLSLERNKIVKMNTLGNETGDYNIPDDLEVRHVAVESGGQWMVCACRHPEEKQSQTIKNRFQLLIYDLRRKTVVSRVAIAHEIRNVTLDSSEHFALIDYKNNAAPQLWRMQNTKGLTLFILHNYIPQEPRVSFAALPSILAGPEDCFVMRAKTDGSILCWDRDTAHWLYSIEIPESYGRLTSFAFNPASWMLVTGTHNGTVLVWTCPTSEPPTATPDHEQAIPGAVIAPPPRASIENHLSNYLDIPHEVQDPGQKSQSPMLASSLPPYTKRTSVRDAGLLSGTSSISRALLSSYDKNASVSLSRDGIASSSSSSSTALRAMYER